MTIPVGLRQSARSLIWLGIGLCMAAGAGWWQARYNDSLAQTRFDALARRAVEQLTSRMHAFEFGLRGARGAVIAAGGEGGITRLRFAQFSASRDLEREFPGSRGFGFVRRVPVAQEAAFVAAARLDGKPDFRIHQLGVNEGDRFVIQYFEPSDSTSPAIGLDIASEPNRRAAAERAMQTGEAAMTAPIALVQSETASPSQLSVLMLLPVYRADTQLGRLQQRRHRSAAARGTPDEGFGWIYTPLIIDEVLKGFDFQDGEFALALADVTPPDKPVPFFTSPGHSSVRPGALKNVLPLNLYGRTWHVEVSAQPMFLKRLNLRSPWAAVLIGSTLALLLALLSFIEQTTQRRKQQAGEQRSRLAAIVTSSNDAIIGCRLDGTITDWNDAAAKIFGYTSQEALGQPMQALLLPPDYAQEEETLLRHIAQGKSVAAFETFRRHRDGTAVAVSVAAAPIRSADGRVLGAAETLRDITHERATKAHILELNATLEQQVVERTGELVALSARERAILDGAASAIIATEVNGMVTLFNPAAEALLGYSAAEVVNQMEMNRFHDVFEVHSRAMALTTELGRPLEVCEVFAPAPGTGRARPREWTYVRKDGSRVAVHLNVSPLRDAAGSVVGFIAIATDLSERKAVEERLHKNERFMRIVTDNIPGIVAYWTTEMRCSFANSAYRRWLGRAPEEMLGITQVELLGPELFRENEPYIRAALAGNDQRVMRTRTLADGSTMHYWLHYIPDFDEYGVVQGFISVAVDVTDMRRAQDQLESLNLALNERSAQAESASKAKSEFLANMSHEIRSPLNAVIGLAYLLRQTSLDDRQREFLRKIDDASNALLGVINDILDISKIEAGEMALDESEFGLGDLLDSAISMMTVDASEKGIALALESGADLPKHLVGDVTRIRQILVNLLSNAVKFTAQGSVRLNVQVKERLEDRLRLRFAVIDTGIGIEADVLDRLFTPFTQADTSTTRRFGGTGLGLSIVKQLTELMGGELGVSSTPVSGSEFWVILPLDIAGEGAIQPALPTRAASTDRRLSRMRVLVADDSAVNLEVCQHILEREGAQVSVALDGREAVETLRRSPQTFDLVLMDVQMPTLDGNEATRMIRSELGLRALPVVALTASALVAERDRALEAGMNDFISKPFDAEVLVRTVRRCVERARGRLVPTAHEEAPAMAPLPPGWPLIQGIDAQGASKRLMGDSALLLSVLRSLLAEFADLAREGDASSGGSSSALAARLHKLQGSAGVIGIDGVRQQAAEGEAALRDGDPQRAGRALRALGAALRNLQAAAQPFFDATDARAGADDDATPIDPDGLASLIDLLRKQSMAAMPLFDELGPSLRHSLGSERFAALERAMQALQFRQAVEILQIGQGA
ncbi:PAS domain S-box protein [Variovorax sp. J22R115]|uniref:CHASE domain-containing hybrid sensor histidine kinase/response regulator n=1 Tax=Variovorax sp. J22R115 TaxID=3053509 RepID=UPI002578A2E4|nr:PAS domain S-box protein [Variovorax sp. J22R115]MDM0048695.1 PAS domain S-box protein [Variovorax sp. J22R115]